MMRIKRKYFYSYRERFVARKAIEGKPRIIRANALAYG
jgi:hypothetical protein